jgi:uncharacterized membrane protein (UPF0127 family)
VTVRAAMLLLVAAVVACTMRPGPRSPSESASRVQPRLVVVPTGGAAPKFVAPVVTVEIAATEASRRRGLGGRASLPPGAGMLFVYREPALHGFWMKDCLVALDIAFLGPDGTVLNVETLPPGVGIAEDAMPKAASRGPAQFVLETPAGRLAQSDVRAGDVVDLSAALAGVVPE